MKKLALGLLIGAGVVYIGRRVQEQGMLENMSDHVAKLRLKSRKKIKDVLDRSLNKAEYIKNMTEYEVDKLTTKLEQ